MAGSRAAAPKGGMDGGTDGGTGAAPREHLLSELIRAHHAAVYGSAWRISRNDADALDVAQRVFLRVLQAPQLLQGHESPERALRWLAAKTALTQRRSDGNRRRREESHAMEHQESDPAPAAAPERAELLARVRAAVARLPEELRVATVLRFQEGLTFAAMAELEGVTEPTMFDRVKRALQKLRTLVAPAGEAAALAELEGLLAIEEAVAVPAHATAALLALPSSGAALALGGSTTAIGGSWIATAAVALALVGGGAVVLHQTRATRPPAAPAVASAADPLDHGARPPPAPAPAVGATRAADPADSAQETPEQETPATPEKPSPTAERASLFLGGHAGMLDDLWSDRFVETGDVSGTLVDDDGRPLSAATVVANSSDGAPKGFAWHGEAVTAADGTFRIHLAVRDGKSQLYVLDATHPDLLPRSWNATVAVHARTDLGRVTALRNAADRAGAYSLTLTLTGPQGEPVEGAAVGIARRLVARAGTRDAPAPSTQWECGGVSDAQGRIELDGTRIGEKEVTVKARGAGYLNLVAPLSVDAPGASEQHLLLRPGLTLRGRIVVPPGMDPKTALMGDRVPASELDDGFGGPPFVLSGEGYVQLAGAQLYAVAPNYEDWVLGTIQEDGSFVLRGLDPGPCTLQVTGGFSTARVDGIEAGREDVVIELKAKDDPRDFGSHLAELHGHAFDAESGAPVNVERADVTVVPLPDDLPSDDPRVQSEFIPKALEPFMGQTCVETRRRPTPTNAIHVTGLDAMRCILVVRVLAFEPAASRVFELRPREIVPEFRIELRRARPAPAKKG